MSFKSKKNSISNNPVNVCMPTLSLGGILLSKLRIKGNNIYINYNLLSFSLRTLKKVFHLSESKLVIIIENIIHISIKGIKFGDNNESFAHLNLSTMELTSELSYQISSEVEQRNSLGWLNELIGKTPAIAYTAKNIAHNTLFPSLISIVSFSYEYNESSEIVVIPNIAWPKSWCNIISDTLDEINVKFIMWPKGYVRIRFLMSFLKINILLVATLFKFILYRGIRLKPYDKEEYKLITEFIDPKKLSNKSYDADYFIDDNILKGDKVLFFLTHKQKKILQSNGHSISDLVHLFKEKHYSLAILDEIGYTFSSLILFIKKLFKFSACVFNIKYYPILRMFYDAWVDYLDFNTLFSKNIADNLIFYTFHFLLY